MPTESFMEKKEESISLQIFSVSAAMVGVCTTVLGLFIISQTLKKIQGIADELITINAILFLVPCFLSYMAMRTKNIERRYNLERIADGFFLAALSLMVLVGIILLWEFI